MPSLIFELFYYFLLISIFFPQNLAGNLIYAESIFGRGLIFTVCLRFVDTLQFNFKYGFGPTFPSPLQQNFEVVAARSL